MYAPSRSDAPAGSADGGRLCIEAEEVGGGEGDRGRVCPAVGVTFEATRQ
jgi:hypothetical protein